MLDGVGVVWLAGMEGGKHGQWFGAIGNPSGAGFGDSFRRLSRAGPAALIGFLRRTAEAENERWFLWCPVGLGVGVAAYFSLGEEPAAWAGAVATAVAFIAFMLVPRWTLVGLAALATLTVAVGFSAAQFRTGRVAAPILPRDLDYTVVVGRVGEVSPRPRGQRLLLDQLR